MKKETFSEKWDKAKAKMNLVMSEAKTEQFNPIGSSGSTEPIAGIDYQETKTEQIRESKPITLIISEYVDRKDVKGLAEYFRAYIIDELLENNQETHDTENGFCCACLYDVAMFRTKLAEQREEIIKSIEDIRKVAPLTDYQKAFNEALEDVLSLITKK